MSVRVRFAPSPTGYLHVGGARTALFNWLFARSRGGAFLLRIEDTDRSRSTEESVRVILDGMTWLGLDWDEEPVFQSRGLERHRADVRALLEGGHAYRDFVPPEELARVREEDPARAVRFPRRQAELLGPDEVAERVARGDPHAIRFRVGAGETRWSDAVHGELSFRNADIEDLVLLQSDGTPTYNLAVASDDAHMGITHVIRGDDHISNTPKQILIFEALGRPLPVFGHVPIVLGGDGKRLSKRHGATAVGDYADLGILPEAMFNFLALLGWSPGTDEEVMTKPELVGKFSIERVLKKSAVFDQTKLEWLNRQHIARIPPGELLPGVLDFLGDRRPLAERRIDDDRASFLHLIEVLKPRASDVRDLARQVAIYVDDEVEYDPDAIAKHWGKDPTRVAEHLTAIRERIGSTEWKADPLEEAVRGLAEQRGVGLGKLIQPLRVGLTGSAASPGIFDVLLVLGRERSLERIDAALDRLGDRGTLGA